jgi:predicted small metal-binding protein
MRVFECNECGETITGADDQELTRHLAAHLREEHDEEPDDEELADLVADQAYDATDS